LIDRQERPLSLGLLDQLAHSFDLEIVLVPGVGMGQFRYGFRFKNADQVDLFRRKTGPYILRWLKRQETLLDLYRDKDRQDPDAVLLHSRGLLPGPIQYETQQGQNPGIVIGGQNLGTNRINQTISLLGNLYYDSARFYNGVKQDTSGNYVQKLVLPAMIDIVGPQTVRAIAYQYGYLGLEISDTSKPNPTIHDLVLKSRTKDMDEFLIQLNLLRAAIKEDMEHLKNASHAMASTTAQVEGGIDLTQSSGYIIKKDPSGGVKVDFDPAMIQEIRREGVHSVVPVVISVTTISSVAPLLGL
jgi:hypothetical protein